MSSIFPGIGISGYRSFGDDLELIGPLDRVNVLIGPNNSGKSTTLTLLAFHMPELWNAVTTTGNVPLQLYERRVAGEASPPLRVAWPLDRERAPYEGQPAEVRGLIDLLEQPQAWPRYRLGKQVEVDPTYVNYLAGKFTAPWWNTVARFVAHDSPKDLSSAVRSVIDALRSTWLMPPPKMRILIPAHRQLTSVPYQGNMPTEWNASGAGVVQMLDELKNPQHHEADKRAQCREIVDRVRDVLELRTFDFGVSRRDETFSMLINDDHRPLDALGTGYEHIFLLVVATVVHPNAFVCVEEPEVHMHPRLQRRLADYLNRGGNQLAISTHSATLIDSLHAKTFRLRLDERVVSSHISQPVAGEVLDAFDELGYRASDLLQANSVIWVEGPSDRLYINAWMHVVAPALEEGIHYQVMSFGGSLLAHISVADAVHEVENRLIPIRQLNQRFVVVTDSDRTSPGAPLKPRVQRLLDEIGEDQHGKVWITAGRTIENYVEPEVIEAAIKRAHPSVVVVRFPADEWDDAIGAFTGTPDGVFEVDKVKVAREVVAAGVNLDRLDLRQRMEEMAALVRAANS